MINRVILIGRLTRDPELRYTANGIEYVPSALPLTDPIPIKRAKGQLIISTLLPETAGGKCAHI